MHDLAARLQRRSLDPDRRSPNYLVIETCELGRTRNHRRTGGRLISLIRRPNTTVFAPTTRHHVHHREADLHHRPHPQCDLHPIRGPFPRARRPRPGDIPARLWPGVRLERQIQDCTTDCKRTDCHEGTINHHQHRDHNIRAHTRLSYR